MDLSSDFNSSTAGKNKSVKYSEGPESSLLDRDVLQVDICHDGLWYCSQTERKRNGRWRAAEPPRGKDVMFHAKRDAINVTTGEWYEGSLSIVHTRPLEIRVSNTAI